MSARVIDRTYPSSGQAFSTVECEACLVVLNSGHHYHERDRHFAEIAAAHHNEVHHNGPPLYR